MKVVDNLKSVLVTVIAVSAITLCVLLCVLLTLIVINILTHILVLAGVPIEECMYVLDDLLEIFEETFSG